VAKLSSKKGKLKRKLTDKYRLVVLNENTFEERFSLKLSLLNVFVLSGFFSVLLVVLTVVFIAFTPVREYIPGYSSLELKIEATNLTFEVDSLKTKLAVLINFTEALKPVLTGEIEPETIDSLRLESESMAINDRELDASKTDSLYREEVESKDRFPLIDEIETQIKIVFFAPLSGNVTQEFDASDKHFAIDIVAKVNTPVKSVADGTVILAEWTLETGYVLTIQHAKGFISVYKHNGTLLKEQGDFVKSGEVIASVGSTGELTTGPHLHFELWSNGYSVDPKNYIDFN
jgi:murein DD-endopeptidase MepM/ murein hydrolase activator NlpD